MKRDIVHTFCTPLHNQPINFISSSIHKAGPPKSHGIQGQDTIHLNDIRYKTYCIRAERVDLPQVPTTTGTHKLSSYSTASENSQPKSEAQATHLFMTGRNVGVTKRVLHNRNLQNT